MSTDSIYERIAGRQVIVSLALVIGAASILILVILTLVFQWLKWIDLTQNFTDLWFWVLFTGLSVSVTLINYGIWQKKKAQAAQKEGQVARPEGKPSEGVESRRAVYGLHTFPESNAELIVRVTVADLSHLTVHYSQRTDTPEHPTRPYYVVNNHTKQAYWVREEIRELNRRGVIQNVTHFGEDDLLRHLNENGIHPNPKYSEKYELC